jgi:uncharacterized protein (DUF885 family)
VPGTNSRPASAISKRTSKRTRTELALRDDFDRQAFHDFVLAHGLLPPDILKAAVMQEFVPDQQRQ